MKNKHMRINKKSKLRKSPVFLIALLNFIIIILILIYIIYLRFIPYQTIIYDGYAVSGKDLVNNLLNTSFDVNENIGALEVRDQDEIYKNLKSYYLGADKKKEINLNYPIYVNDTLALYNLSSDVILVTDSLQMIEGYPGFTLTSGALYNSNTLERADYHNYILMRNPDNMYINTKEIQINTSSNKYTIGMNSIINFTDEFITYYTLKDGNFVYGKVLDIDMNSRVIIEDFNKEYTYKELLIGLDIIREETKTGEEPAEENIVKEEKEEIEKENKVEEVIKNVIQEENNEPEEEPKEEPSNPNTEPVKWQKPTVSCTDFVPNIYTATTEISISDPSGVINKAITFTFYKDEEIAFRASALSSGGFKVTKLVPNTKYKVIGTYQYKNETGGIIEVKFLDQEFKTLDTKNIKPIDLSFKNGQIYSNKIELLDLKINSDITDEAIYGVSRAELKVNGVSYPIGTATLRSILKGNVEKYQIVDGIEPSTKYKYEIKFFDTADNEMNLTNNTGATLTSKAIPYVKVKVTKQNIISLELGITLSNQDKVDLLNYRYIMYTSKGEICKKDKLTTETDKLFFDDLDPNETYTIKIYADFDIEDGNGIIENQEIGNATFTTVALSKLGSLKLDVQYDDTKDLTDSSIKFTTKIDNIKTDPRLVKILKEVNIGIRDENKNVIETINITDINKLTGDGFINEIDNLESNTKYNIVITAKAEQGNVEEDINTTYTLNSFTTRKQPASVNIKNLVVTTNIIDLDIMVFDKDGASLDGNYIIELRDENDKLIEKKEVKANEYVRCTYEELNKNEEYTLTCYAAQYNETNDNRKLKSNYSISTEKYITTGLGGKIELTGLTRKNKYSKNLIDVASYNNWYSKCFDVLKTEYVTDENNKTTFEINSKNRYGKTYNSETKELTLTSNQCYVYNLKEYAGQTVTMSFKAKVSNNSIKDGIYIQKGKKIGENTEQITGLNTSYGNKYVYQLTIPDDGYIGFYLSEDSTNTLIVQELQVELGGEATDYQNYTYDLKTNIQTDFTDEKYITFDKDINEKESCNYYIRFTYNDLVKEYSYNELDKKINNNREYEIEETADATVYKVQLLIKVYGREYVLDEISFKYDPETCYEIKSISSKDEFKDIQPYGNYILLSDIDLTDASTVSANTFGNSDISFYGSIDFNGKTIKKDLYSNNIKKETTSYIFYNLAETAKIKNIVLDIYIDNINKRYDIDVLDGIYPLFLYNNGDIDNIMVNLSECNDVDKRYVSLIGYKNLSTGIIENFIIYFDEILYGTQYMASGVLYSNGTIQNGYMYGKGIKVISDITSYDERNVAGLVYELQSGGIIQNVYNLSGITINHQKLTKSYAANMVYRVNSGANVRNIYSLKEFTTIYENNTYDKLLDTSNKEVDYGPNIYTSSGNVQFSYYFCGTSYADNTYNIKQDGTVLNDYNFQENLLNANGYEAFNVEKYVKNGYYPHLNLNVCMPTQEKIEIEMSKDDNIMDVLSSKIVKYDTLSEEIQEKLNGYDFNDENVHIAVFNVYNPSGRTIIKINIDYITNTTIVHQNYSKKMSTVYAVLSDPTTFIDKYNISSVTGINITGNEKTVTYGQNGELGKRTIEVSFVKYIKTAEEWDNIDNNDENGISGLIQNYKLDVDIDFNNPDNTEYTPFISGTFTGTMDGQGHTLSNITGNGNLFDTLNSSLKNLYVNGYNISTSSSNVGLIGKIGTSSTIDNIHVKDIELYSSSTSGNCYIGGLIGYINGSNVNIKNSSISNLTVNLEKSTSTNNHTIGGIVGYWDDSSSGQLNINNCYTQGINITSENTYISGIGGILGYAYNDAASTLNIRYCYSEGKIVTDKPYAGGIYGRISHSNPSYIKYCYSLVNITGNMTTGNEYIGGIGGYHASSSATSNNLYLGNIYVKKATTTYSRRIVGNQEYSKNYKNYGYIDQIINGAKSSTLYGATGLLAYNEIFDESIYTNILQFGENYDYNLLTADDGRNILPKLYDTYGNLLPNQKDNILENGLKIMSVDYQYYTVNTENDSVKIKVKFENMDNLLLKNIDFKFENDDLSVKEILSKQDTTENEINYTTIQFIATPNKYYDTYKLSEIIYINNNGEEKTLYSPMKISTAFYKEIYNANDWNTKTDTTSAENYKIMQDIDFSNVENIVTNVSIGRLITKDNEIKTISGVKLQFSQAYSGLIKEIKTQITNVNFRNFTITANANNVGIIYQISAPMTKCNFDNIVINGSGYDYIGIISRCISGSSVSNITLNNIKLYGRNYIGSLCGYKNSSGTFQNITGNYIEISASGNYVGGIMGYSVGGSLINIKAYQYSETGNDPSNTISTDYLVKGISNVGGCIGYTNSSVNTIETKHSIVKATGSQVGGCIGWINGNNATNVTSSYNSVSSNVDNIGGCIGYAYGNMTNITSQNNLLIKGSSYVGGCIGRSFMWGGGSSKKITSENNTEIKGTSYVGGCIGSSENYSSGGVIADIKSLNNTVNGTSNRIGGCIGYSTGRIRNAKTYYESSSAASNISGNDYVGGIVGQHTYNVTNTGISYYSADGAYVINANISGRNYVGGFSGDQRGTVYAAAVDNTTINASGSYAGGITGYYQGSTDASASKISCKNFYLMHSFCTNSIVKAASNVGGLVGYFVYGNIQYCYVGNTNINATTENAGGLVGFFNNNNMTSKQYIATIKYNFIANTNGSLVSSATGVGGLIGTINKELYVDEDIDEEGNVTRRKYYIQSNLIVTDIKASTGYVSMGIGKVNFTEDLGRNQINNMEKIYVYDCSKIGKDNSNTYVYLDRDESGAYYNNNRLVTCEELGNVDTYTNTEKLNFVDTNNRFEFEAGYFPILNILTATSTQTYWGTSYLNVQQNKIAVPTLTQTTTASASNFSMMRLMSSLSNQLPDMYTYTVDVNKINIEFSETSPNLFFDIKTIDGKVILERQSITERVYTLEYDFNTELIVTISNLNNRYTETIDKKRVQNLLDIQDDEYLYISDNKLHSNKREFDGEYLNLYNGKVLKADGNIYDVQTMKLLQKSENKIKFLDTQIPLAKTDYEEIEIHTFYHCSKVIQGEEDFLYKDQQIFIKNGTIYLADGDLDSIGTAIIIDSYNNKEYETILGVDGRMYDLLTEINYPNDFKNENIIAMTNNINNNNNIVLVYYSTGRVYGFNYITGEEVYDNNIGKEEVSLLSYIVDSFNFGNVLYETKKSNYIQAQELTEKLEHISIDKALEDITGNTTQEEIDISKNNDITGNNINKNENSTSGENQNTSTQNKKINEKYITTYDAKTQSYVVYSTSELLDGKFETTKSENEKINDNGDLISYYTNVSTSKTKLKDLGIVIFTVILLMICSGLIIMYRKNTKRNR